MWTVLGIKNCDTVRKARRLLEARGVQAEFRDIRDRPLSDPEWRALIRADESSRLVNTRSPSFRGSGLDKRLLDDETKLDLLRQTPTAMKRPVLLRDGELFAIGFDRELYPSIDSPE
jgi:Spx/MgsR family transcriptional regulator